MDIEALRRLFPVTGALNYLNNASESPLNSRSRSRLDEYIARLSTSPHDKPPVRYSTKVHLSSLLGGRPDDYALVTSTGVGIGIVAAGINWQPGDNIVIPADEHWNNSYPWFNLRRLGVDVRVIPSTEDNRVLPELIAAAVDGRTRAVAVAAVRFNSGFRANLSAIAAVAHRYGALFVVDAAQGAGVVPINVDSDGIDAMACGGFKWMLGMHGTGFLYVSEKARGLINPVLPGMYAAENDLRDLRYLRDARRYETGTIPYQLYHAWAAGLEILGEVGIDNIHRRVLDLTSRIIDGISAQPGKRLITPTTNESERSAIVVFSAGSDDDNRNLHQRLLARKVVTTLRAGLLRVSPNFFNTESEIDEFLNAIEPGVA